MSEEFNASLPILLFLSQSWIFSGNVESFLPFFTASIRSSQHSRNSQKCASENRWSIPEVIILCNFSQLKFCLKAAKSESEARVWTTFDLFSLQTDYVSPYHPTSQSGVQVYLKFNALSQCLCYSRPWNDIISIAKSRSSRNHSWNGKKSFVYFYLKIYSRFLIQEWFCRFMIAKRLCSNSTQREFIWKLAKLSQFQSTKCERWEIRRSCNSNH